MNPLEVLKAAHIRPSSPAEVEETMRLLQSASESPDAVVAELLSTRKSRDKAVSIAEQSEKLIESLLQGNGALFHLESVRRDADGSARAVCSKGGNGPLQQFGVHPEVDTEELQSLQPWEFVLVHEGLVISQWRDDPYLLQTQMGDVVEFKGYANREAFQINVSDHGHTERLVTLAEPLRAEEFHAGSRLVLQRDDSRWAIGQLPAERTESQFEVPLDRLTTRLDDLAGVDGIARELIQDILLRVVFEDAKEEFDLEPMNGVLLYSCQPGMGKTALCEGLGVWLREFGEDQGFDVALFHIKPNQLRSKWWGEDGRMVREDLFGAIRARQSLGRERPLIILVVFDEIDSLQKRAGSQQNVNASSHSDALEALLVEMQGLGNRPTETGPASHVLCIGLTNRPDRLDDALKRPGRFGDLVLAMPALTQETAEDIAAIYARKETLPWSLDGTVRSQLAIEDIKTHFLRPAVARIFPAVVATYATDSQQTSEITAGQILVGAHYRDAMKRARKRAAMRKLLGGGIPAICFEDVYDCLLDVAVSTAQQMEADPGMLVQQLQIKVPVVRVTAVPKAELEHHRFVKLKAV